MMFKIAVELVADIFCATLTMPSTKSKQTHSRKSQSQIEKHSLMETTGSNTVKVVHHPNPPSCSAIETIQQSNDIDTNHDSGSDNEVSLEGYGGSEENDSPEASLGCLSDTSTDLDPEHPDYALIKRAKLRAQKSKL
jgi:hypothetical protein